MSERSLEKYVAAIKVADFCILNLQKKTGVVPTAELIAHWRKALGIGRGVCEPQVTAEVHFVDLSEQLKVNEALLSAMKQATLGHANTTLNKEMARIKRLVSRLIKQIRSLRESRPDLSEITDEHIQEYRCQNTHQLKAELMELQTRNYTSNCK